MVSGTSSIALSAMLHVFPRVGAPRTRSLPRGERLTARATGVQTAPWSARETRNNLLSY